MLQNRVNPYGDIIKTPARGHWMGNRGLLHDENKTVTRPYKLKAWITCLLQFKGRKREVMAKNRYTELFFWDEATSFAAGHRPCFECRRADYNIFKAYWLKGNPEYGFDESVSIQRIDGIIHQQRMANDGSKVMYNDNPSSLPFGTFIHLDGKPYLLASGVMHEWSPAGYSTSRPLPNINEVDVLTPKSIVNAFRAGYKPQIIL